VVPVLDRNIDQAKDEVGKANRIRNFECRQKERLTFESLFHYSRVLPHPFADYRLPFQLALEKEERHT
jgi:hypothetical protein